LFIYMITFIARIINQMQIKKEMQRLQPILIYINISYLIKYNLLKVLKWVKCCRSTWSPYPV